MICLHGTISFGTATGTGEPDEFGIPRSSIEWGDYVPCMYLAVTDDQRGRYEDGHFHRSAYTVHIAPPAPYEAKRARLRSIDGRDLGEFPVQSVTQAVIIKHVEIDLGV